MSSPLPGPAAALPTRRRGRSLNALALQLSAVALSFILVALLVVHTSQQAFSDTTANTANSVGAVNIDLNDNDNDVRMFNITGLVPNTVVYRCITVSYTGTLTPTAVQLYSSGAPTTTSTGSLAPYLNLTVDVGPSTGASFSGTDATGCTGFTSSPTSLFSGTLDGFATAYPNYGTSRNTTWTPATGQSRTFRFGVSVQDTNDAINKNTQFGFQWETRTA
jgi:hypothetical protein